MADTTTVLALPFPEGADANDVPADMQALAERLDETPGVESLTSAEISALTSGEKPAGRVVYNSTTSTVQVSNGTSFVDISTMSTVGTYSNWTPAITGSLANPTANSSTGRYTQIGKHVSGWGRIVGFTSAGAGGANNYSLSLPVTPRDNSGYTRLGVMQIVSSVTNALAQFQLELYTGKALPIRQTHGAAEDGDSLVTYKYFTGGDLVTFFTSGTVTIEYAFTYEAA